MLDSNNMMGSIDASFMPTDTESETRKDANTEAALEMGAAAFDADATGVFAVPAMGVTDAIQPVTGGANQLETEIFAGSGNANIHGGATINAGKIETTTSQTAREVEASTKANPIDTAIEATDNGVSLVKSKSTGLIQGVLEFPGDVASGWQNLSKTHKSAVIVGTVASVALIAGGVYLLG